MAHNFLTYIEQTLSKEAEVDGKPYRHYNEMDEDGNHTDFYFIDDDDLQECFYAQHYTPLELINSYSELVKKMLPTLKDDDLFNAKFLLKESEEWSNDETKIKNEE